MGELGVKKTTFYELVKQYESSLKSKTLYKIGQKSNPLLNRSKGFSMVGGIHYRLAVRARRLCRKVLHRDEAIKPI